MYDDVINTTPHPGVRVKYNEELPSEIKQLSMPNRRSNYKARSKARSFQHLFREDWLNVT